MKKWYLFNGIRTAISVRYAIIIIIGRYQVAKNVVFNLIGVKRSDIMKLVGMPLEDIIKCLKEMKEMQAISFTMCPHPETKKRMDALNDSLVLLEFFKKQFDSYDSDIS